MFTHDFEGEKVASGKRKKKFKGESFEATPTETPRKNEPIKTLVSETNNKDIDLESDEFYDDAKQEDMTEEQQKLEEIDRKLAELKQREEEQEETRRRKQAEKELEERIRNMEKERLEKAKELRKKELEELENNRRLEEELQQRYNERDKHLEIEREKHKEEMLLLKEKQEKENMQRKLGNEEKQDVDDEKRRKKELIARMKAIDRGEDPDEVSEPPPKNPVNNQPNQLKPRKKKPIFLASSETHNSDDENFLNHEPLDFSKPSKPNKNQNGDQNSSNFLLYDPLDFSKPKAVSRRNTDDSVKSAKSDRRNSWEFKQTDENLHRGLPSQTGINDSPKLPRRNTKDSDITKHNSASSSGRHGRRQTSGISSGDKKNREATLTDEDLKTEYTPSSLNNSPGPLTSKPVRKNNYNLAFAEFEDPFGLGKPKTNKPKPTANTLVFSSDEDELDSPGYQPSKPTVKKPMTYNQNNSVRLRSPGVVEDDDLEETILA